MGMRSSWVAWQEPSLDEVVEAIGLEVIGPVELMEPGFHAFERDQHQLFVANGFDFLDQITDELARDLSASSPAYFWTADDTSMTGSMSAWHDGEKVWSLTYLGGMVDPIAEGEVPAVYGSLLAEQRATQDQESRPVDHIYEVLHRLGQALVGFRHDEYQPPEGKAPYLELRPSGDELPISHINADEHFVLSATGHWDDFEIEVRARTGGTATLRRLDLDDDGQIQNLIEKGSFELAAEESWHGADATDERSFVLMVLYTVGDEEGRLLLRIDPA